MSATRRQFLELAAAGAGITAALGFAPVSISGAAPADAYPGKTIKIVIPSAPGGPLDIPARLTAQALAKFGQPVVVEHRPGAAGAIGTREVVKAAPDGYTLLSGGAGGLAVLPAMSASTGFDPVKDLAAVANVLESFQVVAVNPSSPWKSIADLVAHAKANPGKLNFGFGLATLPQILGETFKSVTGTDIASIPYKGGAQAITDMLGGRIDMNFGTLATLLPLVQQGKVRALAVTTETRAKDLPDVPTMTESGLPQLTLTFSAGVLAPAGTPPAIVERLNAAFNEALKSPELVASMAKLGFDPQVWSTQQYAAFLNEEMRRWPPLVKASGVQPE